MGFQGAAYATVVAQYAEAALMWWFAFKGPRRVNFFGGERIENETCLEKDDDPSSAGTDETTISHDRDVSDDTEQVCDPASYVFDKDLAWKFFREATSMLGRVANVVAVWAGTSALAARIGVYSGAAHVLLFQIICIISIAAGALTTVSNAVASRLQVSEGDSAASGAGAALSLLGVAIFAVICSVFWGIRVPLLTNFTPDTRVVEAALRSYPVVMMCVLTYFYKALEGALIGRGDAKSVNAVFALGGIVCAASLAWFSSQGPLTLQGVWCSLFLYYVALTAGMLTRWVQLDRGGVPVGGRTFKTTPAAPIAVEDDA
jgi:Na+-driven multidrug efflux pump